MKLSFCCQQLYAGPYLNDLIARHGWLLTSAFFSCIKIKAAVAATRGDLGQLAPRKKLLKS
jgi:hypothetical protein